MSESLQCNFQFSVQLDRVQFLKNQLLDGGGTSSGSRMEFGGGEAAGAGAGAGAKKWKKKSKKSFLQKAKKFGKRGQFGGGKQIDKDTYDYFCLLYTSPSPRD